MRLPVLFLFFSWLVSWPVSGFAQFESLPLEVQLELAVRQLQEAIVTQDHAESLKVIDVLRRIDPAADTTSDILFFEAEAAIALDQIDRGEAALTRFLTVRGRASENYDDALGLMIEIPRRRAAQQAEVRRQEEQRQEAIRSEEEERIRQGQLLADDNVPAAATHPTSVPAQIVELEKDHCVIVIAARKSVEEVRAFVSELPDDLRGGVRIFTGSNGWNAISIGSLASHRAAEAIHRKASAGSIPMDSYCTQGETFTAEMPRQDIMAEPLEFSPTHRIATTPTGYLNMRGGSGNDQRILLRLPVGSEVHVESINDRGWAQVSTRHGYRGWAYSDFLQPY